MAIIRKGQLVNDRFEMSEVIGTGGAGSVWLGHDRQLDRLVAIKRMVATGFDNERRQQAIDEARTIANITNPYIVAVYDIVTYDDELLIVMEYLPGGSLHEYLRKKSNERSWVPIPEALRLLKGILNGLSAAHTCARGAIIHRDLKPENILFDAMMRPKIADFGLAVTGRVEPIETVHSINREHPGTQGFMAPEQLRGEELDCRTDLFNVGLLAYLLLGAVHPFTDPRNLFNFREMLLSPYRDLPPLSSHSLPAEVQQFVITLLANDPASRFQTAQHALDELEEIERRYNEMVLAQVVDLHDSLKTGKTPVSAISAEELAYGIGLCKRNQFYVQGAYLYEHSGVDFSQLRDDAKSQLENEYQFCRRRTQMEASNS